MPPIGWDEASRYLALPVLLVVAQFVSSAVITLPADPNDDSAKTTQARPQPLHLTLCKVPLGPVHMGAISARVEKFLPTSTHVATPWVEIRPVWRSI